MSADTTRWDRIEALFHEALSLPEGLRQGYVERECGGDDDLAAEVLALLREDAGGAPVLDAGLAQIARQVLDASLPIRPSIGAYRILGELGRGGMGVVYLAEREDLHQRVAIKLLQDASLSPLRRERFVREEQALAQLSHPSIGRLYHADVLPDGTPFFVMEYVEGRPLLEYCEARGSTIRERLLILRAVCEAVQFAHRHAIIHRDLKPSNILVSDGDGDGPPTVKLLDFGIAKQLDALDTTPSQTQTLLPLMTPAYAAPEQVRGGPVGTYTDVYALGVILYELLTGERPYDLTGLTPGQVEKVILEAEPERPSVRVRHSGARWVGRRRPKGGASAWADLDVLCMTALQKDPQRRYPTVEALARDLDHHLQAEPLEARPDSLPYRAAKFLRRNARAVAAASLIVGVVSALVVFFTVRLAAARDVALTEAARTQRVQHFMLSLIQGDEGRSGPPDTLRVVALLERAELGARALSGDPDLQADLYSTLGRLRQQLGDFDRADSLLRTALDLRRARFGADHPEVARALVALGLLRVDQARLSEAERLVREGLRMSRRADLPGQPAVSEAASALGRVLEARGDYDGAIEFLTEAVRLRSAHDSVGADLGESLEELANAHFYAGRYATADSLNRLVLAVDRRVYGARHPAVADALVNLGATQHQLGYYRVAERLHRQALEILLSYYGPDHPETASVMMMLAQALTFQNRFPEALALLRPALAVRERVYGPDHPRVANTLNEIATVELKQGDLAGAEADFRRVTDIYRRAYHDDHYLIGIGLSNLASVYREAGQYDRAEAALRDAIARFTKKLPPDHMHTATARVKLGRVLVLEGRHAEAEAPLLAGYRVLSAKAKPSVRWLQEAREDLAAVYEALGRPREAARFRAEWAANAGRSPG